MVGGGAVDEGEILKAGPREGLESGLCQSLVRRCCCSRWCRRCRRRRWRLRMKGLCLCLCLSLTRSRWQVEIGSGTGNPSQAIAIHGLCLRWSNMAWS